MMIKDRKPARIAVKVSIFTVFSIFRILLFLLLEKCRTAQRHRFWIHHCRNRERIPQGILSLFEESSRFIIDHLSFLVPSALRLPKLSARALGML